MAEGERRPSRGSGARVSDLERRLSGSGASALATKAPRVSKHRSDLEKRLSGHGRGAKPASVKQRYRQLFVKDAQSGRARRRVGPGLTERLRRWMFATRGGLAVLAVDMSLSLMTCVFYVYETYRAAPAYFADIEVASACVFLCVYALRVLMADKAVAYVLGAEGMVDILTILPAVFAYDSDGSGDGDGVSWLRLLRMLRVLRVMRLSHVRDHMQSEVSAAVYTAVATCVAAMFISSCLVQFVENLDAELREEPLAFHDAVYFLVVTVTTVGYGDISPVTDLGRLVVATVVIGGVAWLPVQAGRIVQLSSLASVYSRRSYTERPGVRHVVVCGDVDICSIKDLCSAQPRGRRGKADHVVLLQPRAPSMQLKALLASPFSFLSLTYLEGALTDQGSLRRARAARARAIFIVAAKRSSSALKTDARTLVYFLAVQRYLFEAADRFVDGQPPLVSVQVQQPSHRASFVVPPGSQLNAPAVVCINQVKQGLIGKTVLSPGLSTLMCNLIMTPQLQRVANPLPWEVEYQHGCRQQVHRSRLSKVLRGFSFCEAALFVWENHRATLFAVEVHASVAPPRVLLNPGSWVLPANPEVELFGFVISEHPVDLFDVHSLEGAPHRIEPRRRDGSPALARKHIRGALGKLRAYRKVAAAAAAAAAEGEDEQAEDDDDDDVGGNNTMAAARLRAHAAPSFIDCERLDEAPYRAALEQICLLRERPKPFAEATLDTMAVYGQRDHVLVIGPLEHLFHLILPLRSRYLRLMPEIVLMGPEPPSENEWSHLRWFSGVHYVKGSALDTSDLQRAGVETAARVVLLASKPEEAETTDYAAIFAFQAVRRLNPSLEIVTEVAATDDLAFLSPELVMSRSVAQWSPHYAAGNVFLSSCVEYLSAHACYAPGLVDVFDTLLSDKLPGHHHRWERSMSAMLDAVPYDSHCFAIPCPPNFVGVNYASLFAWLLRDNMLPLGLRRGVIAKIGRGRQQNELPYVVAAPTPDTELGLEDVVFVLSQRTPERIVGVEAVPAESPSDAKFVRNTPMPQAQRRLSDPLSSRTLTANSSSGGSGSGGIQAVQQELASLRQEVRQLAEAIRPRALAPLAPSPSPNAQQALKV